MMRRLGGKRGLRVAALQLSVSESPSDNIARAAALIDRAAGAGADLVALPECFVGKYGVNRFASWAEPVPLDTSSDGTGGASMMAERASHHGIVVLGGVIEQAGDTLYNSMPVYGPTGSLLALYRKIHLSRVLGITSESDVLTAGSQPITFRSPSGGMLCGMLCCFDLRFRDLLVQYGHGGANGPCDVLCAPSAFLHTTGIDHWDLLIRRAALDGQSFVVAPNVAYSDEDAVPLYGRSAVVDAWGRIMSQCDAVGDGMALADVEQSAISDVRGKIPLADLAVTL
jgi:predicted amidohydrolase